MNYQYYPTDLSDAEWEKIRPLLPPEKPVGKQREVDLREVLNAIFYRADNGIKWRALPSDFPAIALRAFKKGKLSMATSAYGSDWGFGSRLILSWLNKCEWRRDGSLSQA
jgi:transposase